MDIKQFNELHKAQFQFVEIEPYTRHTGQVQRRFQLQQWCPKANKWARMLLPGQWCFASETEPEFEPIAVQLTKIPKHIIVITDKYTTAYYDASNTEAIGLVALDILKQRKEEGWYEEPEQPVTPLRKPEEFSDDAELKDAVQRQWDRYQQDMQYYRREIQFYNRVTEALQNNDYYLACRLLESRSEYEYERFEIVALTTWRQ